MGRCSCFGNAGDREEGGGSRGGVTLPIAWLASLVGTKRRASSQSLSNYLGQDHQPVFTVFAIASIRCSQQFLSQYSTPPCPPAHHLVGGWMGANLRESLGREEQASRPNFLRSVSRVIGDAGTLRSPPTMTCPKSAFSTLRKFCSVGPTVNL